MPGSSNVVGCKYCTLEKRMDGHGRTPRGGDRSSIALLSSVLDCAPFQMFRCNNLRSVPYPLSAVNVCRCILVRKPVAAALRTAQPLSQPCQQKVALSRAHSYELTAPSCCELLLARIISRVDVIDASSSRAGKLYLDDGLFVARPNIMRVPRQLRVERTGLRQLPFLFKFLAHAKSNACPCRKSNPSVLMVQAAENRSRLDASY